jgi:ABC-2 type transport system ATP-binding protein
MTPMIEARGLTKRYGKTRALDGLDLTAPRGQVVAVLGPNGAGKTTFVRIVATLLAPDEGTLCVAGHDVRRDPGAVRRAIGLAGQFAAIEPAMTGRENLAMVARLFGLGRRGSGVAGADQLDSRTTEIVWRARPGGMRRRLTPVPARRRPRPLPLDSRPPAWTRAAVSSCGIPSALWWRGAPMFC